MNYIELESNQDNEVVSCVRFVREDMLLTSTYSCKVRLHNNPGGSQHASILTQLTSPSPTLCVTNTLSQATILGHLDGTLRYLDYENMKVSEPIIESTVSEKSGINFCKTTNLNTIVASTYAGDLWQVDPRSPKSSIQYKTSGKIFAMDTCSNYITLGKAKELIEIFDVRRFDSALSVRSTGLRYQITALCNLPVEDGYAISGIDGRVSIDYYDELEETVQKKFAFKCHREKGSLGGAERVFPVTDLAFHPIHKTLFTSGGDGHVCIWNWQKKKRMKELPSVPLLGFITQMDLNTDGTCLAVGVNDSSFLLSQLGKAKKAVGGKVYVRQVTDAESQPKSR